MRAMKELVPDVKIEKMPLPFAAVAADLLTGREVVLDRGGLYDAIRASISIPSVFRPVRRGNQCWSTAVRSIAAVEPGAPVNRASPGQPWM